MKVAWRGLPLQLEDFLHVNVMFIRAKGLFYSQYDRTVSDYLVKKGLLSSYSRLFQLRLVANHPDSVLLSTEQVLQEFELSGDRVLHLKGDTEVCTPHWHILASQIQGVLLVDIHSSDGVLPELDNIVYRVFSEDMLIKLKNAGLRVLLSDTE